MILSYFLLFQYNISQAWVLYTTDIFNNQPFSNWVNAEASIPFTSTYICPYDQFSSYLGKIDYTANIVTKTYSNLKPHYQLRLLLEAGIMYDWNDDTLVISADSTTIVVITENSNNYQSTHYCEANCDLKFIDQSVFHSGNSVLLKFQNSFTYATVYFKRLLLRNILIYTQLCQMGCLTCSDGTTCLTCPPYSTKVGSICICDLGRYLIEYECELDCPTGYTKDETNRKCVKQCPNNCSSCTTECITCDSGYLLLLGQCVQTCPTHSIQIGSNTCKDYQQNYQQSSYLFKGFYDLDPIISTSYIDSIFTFTEGVTKSFLQTQKFRIINNQFVLGGIGVWISGTIAIQFNSLTPHFQIRIYFKSYFIDYVPTTYNIQIDSTNHNIPITTGTNVIGGTNVDSIFNTQYTLAHTQTTLSIKWIVIQSTYTDPYVASFALSDIYILIDKCSDHCTVCSSDVTCNTCETGYLLYSNQCYICDATNNRKTDCSCLDNYYANTYKCLACNSYCDGCTTVDQCVNCKVSTQRTNPPLCNTCPIQYYAKIGVDNCQNCHSSCRTCNGDQQSNCLTCISPNYMNPTNLCQPTCPSNYYKNNSDPNNLICSQCTSPCANCEIISSRCLSCITGNLFNYTCISGCPSSYFLNSSGICQICDSPCLECINSSTYCIKCASGLLLHNNTCLTNCPSQYYPLNEGCQHCQSGCEECNLAECTKCLNSYYYQYQDQQCKNQCIDGYFGNSNRICQICHQSCKTCSGDSIQDCLSCNNNSVFQIIVSPKGRCGLKCQLGYFNNNNICQQCDNSCSVCLDNTNKCLQCNTNYYKNLNGQCKTTCDDQYYIDTTLKVCIQCHTDCKTCNGPYQNQCLTCMNNKVILNGQCINECPIKYVNISSNCQPCTNNCDICTGIAINQCTKCSFGIFYLNHTCLQICPSNYYGERLTYTCEPCPQYCKQCYQNICQVCQTSYYLHQSKCLSVCPDGYYGQNQQCEQCDPTCITCSGGLNNQCLTCITGLLLHANQCLPSCPSKYYPSTNQCLPCHSTCLTCTSPTICNNCDNNLYLNGTSCIATCPSTTYKIESTKKCESCHSSCTTCFGPTAQHCLTCPVLFYLYQCVTSCPVGFSQIGNSCEPTYPISLSTCAVQCDTCSLVQINCSKCASNRMHEPPTCGCPAEYYDDGSPTCKKCPHKCQLCTQGGCVACKGNRITDQCVCPKGYYEDNISQDCPKCRIQCATCSNGNNCDSCLNNRVNPGSCQCQDGYFEAYEPLCKKCQKQCSKCVDFENVCTECASNRIQLPLCVCPIGYYDAGVSECKLCDLSCSSCDKSGCITCAGNRVGPMNGICECPSNSLSRIDIGSSYCGNCEIGVPQIRFSNDLSYIIVDFGIDLIQNSNIDCHSLLESVSEFGNEPQCQIVNKKLNIILDYNSTIVPGQIIKFKSNLLQQFGCTNQYQNILQNSLLLPSIDQSLLIPSVVFTPLLDTSICLNLQLSFKTQINDGKRQFKILKWKVLLPNEHEEQLTNYINELNPIPYSLIIPPLILKPFVLYRIEVQITNFLNYTNSQVVEFTTQSSESLIITFQQLSGKLFRYQSHQVFAEIGFYNCSNTQLIDVPIKYKWNDEEEIEILANSNNFVKQFVKTYEPFSVGIGTNQVSLSIYLASDPRVMLKRTMEFEILSGDLRLSIIGGNKVVGFTQNITLNLSLVDLDISFNQTDLLYPIEWSCQNVNDKQDCTNQDGDKLNFTSNERNQQILAKQLTPYNSYIIIAKSVKNNIYYNSTCTIQIIEIDIPQLEVEVVNARILNYYEEQYFKFSYQNTNPDALSYGGAIVYNQDVQSTFKFYFLQLKFTLWNYFNNLTTDNNIITFRASIYNPRYLMPSITSIKLEFNIPPQYCILQYQATQPIIEFQTDLMIWVSNCTDPQYQYRYMLYSNQSSLDNDTLQSNNLNYKLIQDFTQDSTIYSILPFSNNNQNLNYSDSILAVSVQDSQLGIANLTTQIRIYRNDNLTEEQLNQYIQDKLNLNSKLYAYNIVVERLINIEGMEDFKYQIFRELLLLSENDLQSQQKDIIYQCLGQLTALESLQIYFVNNSDLINTVQKNTQQSYAKLLEYQQLQNQQLLDSSGNQQKELYYRQYYRNSAILSSILNAQITFNQSQIDFHSNINEIVDNLGQLTIPNQSPHNITTKAFKMDIRFSTEKIINEITGNILTPQTKMNRLLSVNDTNNDNNSVNYYQFSNIRYHSNAYYLDQSFPKNSTNYEAANISLINNSTKTPPTLQQNISIQFSKPENQSVKCISQLQNEWQADICQTVIENDQIVCKCEELSPTSIMNSVEAIIDKTGSLFTQNALDSISNFNYAQTAAFWVYLGQTFIYAMVVVWGYQKDMIQGIAEDKTRNDTEINVNARKGSTNQIIANIKRPQIYPEDNFLKIIYEKDELHETDTQLNSAAKPTMLHQKIPGLIEQLQRNDISQKKAFLLYVKHFHQLSGIIYKYDQQKSRPLRATIVYISILGSLSTMFLFSNTDSILFLISFAILTAPANKVLQLILEKTLSSKTLGIRIIGLTLMIICTAFSSYVMLVSLATFNSISMANLWTMNYEIAFFADNLIYSILSLFVQFLFHSKLLNVKLMQFIIDKILDDEGKKFLYGSIEQIQQIMR